MSQETNGTLILNGKEYGVSFPVINFRDEQRGMSFHTPDRSKHWGERSDPTGKSIECIILHWDVAKSSKDCFQALVDRGLSIHLMIDYDGTVYQSLDLAKRAWHAGSDNDHSVGIEINNPYDVKHYDPNWPREIVNSRTPNKQGKFHKHLDFRPEQKTRVVEVVEALCSILDVPRKLPPLDSEGKVVARTLQKNEINGVLGHFHTSSVKIDPGDTLWPMLQESFSNPF
ncbi:6504_t:CDS:1 [Diversispora eburnea]|uniref:N-acetylmuramoyl-L-alanine amidase n=1 Tax=Diversispora eburnea TaxID=1213867 RepID=A0A9N9F5B4_9GLOM|nr:6504_t:CDS:1 [Diversispora eburnea]